MKTFCILLLFLVVFSGCNDEPDDLVSSLRGNWRIASSYSALKVNQALKKKNRTTYTNLTVNISSNGKLSISQYYDWDILTIASGTVHGSAKQLLFDENVSSVLHSIAPEFEIPFPAMEYTVVKSGTMPLEINYSFINPDGEIQYEGFILMRIIE